MDPDPTFHPDVDPDPGPDLTDLIFQRKAQTLKKRSNRLIPYSIHFGFETGSPKAFTLQV